jgi:anti-anti-sigma factor
MSVTGPRVVPPAFHCETEPDRDRVVLRPCGELDLATVPEVQGRYEELRDAGFTHVVLDLAGLSFMDSSGIALLVRLTRDAPADCRVTVAPGGPDVRHILEVTGLADHLPYEPARLGT